MAIAGHALRVDRYPAVAVEQEIAAVQISVHGDRRLRARDQRVEICLQLRVRDTPERVDVVLDARQAGRRVTRGVQPPHERADLDELAVVVARRLVESRRRIQPTQQHRHPVVAPAEQLDRGAGRAPMRKCFALAAHLRLFGMSMRPRRPGAVPARRASTQCAPRRAVPRRRQPSASRRPSASTATSAARDREAPLSFCS